ncbi:Uu.00g087430.m01.CDS01 [Anthostomella pinea]|uniref:Uu.00g087430.m01.CDS01 n=1 Tax=Anthostomella pinea TaxID=933095 RepID=A0AAI8VN00_9PEZI|nr:Uu.00g087430.m01.CDS01 [Anthostomella pinea]
MKAGVLSGTSTCHTFDSAADRYGRADGIGALYVKRLSDAIADGDPGGNVERRRNAELIVQLEGLELMGAGVQLLTRVVAASGCDVQESLQEQTGLELVLFRTIHPDDLTSRDMVLRKSRAWANAATLTRNSAIWKAHDGEV